MPEKFETRADQLPSVPEGEEIHDAEMRSIELCAEAFKFLSQADAELARAEALDEQAENPSPGASEIVLENGESRMMGVHSAEESLHGARKARYDAAMLLFQAADRRGKAAEITRTYAMSLEGEKAERALKEAKESDDLSLYYRSRAETLFNIVGLASK